MSTQFSTNLPTTNGKESVNSFSSTTSVATASTNSSSNTFVNNSNMGQYLSSDNSISSSTSPVPDDNSSQVCVQSKPSNTTTITRKNQQVVTQQIVTSRRVRTLNSPDDNNTNDNDNNTSMEKFSTESCPQEISTMTNSGGRQCKVTKITKTYRRRIIKKTGPNGEVTEQIIEEGDPIDMGMMSSLPVSSSANQLALSGPSSMPSTSGGTIAQSSSSNQLVSTGSIKGTGSLNVQAVAGFKSTSETGEEQCATISSGPLSAIFGSSNKMLMSADGSGNGSSTTLDDSNDDSNVHREVMPDGSIVMRKFNVKKTATVTHSSTVNGETKTSSKSAFMCFTGETMNQAQSSIDDMEQIFQNMMQGIGGGNPFDILDHFIQNKESNIGDHLALAGGYGDSMPCKLLAIEPSTRDEDTSIGHSAVSKLNKFIKKPIKIFSSHPESIPELQLSSESPAIVGGANNNNSSSSNHGSTAADPVPILTETWTAPPISKEQEQDLIRRKIEEIREKKSSKGLYWSEMDEVRNSGILSQMKKEEIHLQEALFEIITSEASYNIGLDTLINYYYKNDLLDPSKPDATINSVEKHHLFSNVLLVKGVSFKLLKDLESKWSQQKPRLNDLGDVLLKHAEDEEFKQQYIRYLTNQSYQIDALRTLLQKDQFRTSLQTIQSDPHCGKLSLDSFLALPMQRLTRMKLLVDVVLKLMNQCPEFINSTPKSIIEKYNLALERLKELLSLSEENKHRMELKARMMDILKILEFPSPCKAVSLSGEHLIKEGEVRAHSCQASTNILKKLSKKKQPTFYLLVFSNTVILAKKKAPGKLLVMDYCNRDKVCAEVVSDQNAISSNSNSAASHKTSTVSMTVLSSNSSASVSKLARDRSVGSSMSSTSSRDSTLQLDQACANNQVFLLKFQQSKTLIMTEPLILSVANIDERDEWLSAISSK